MKHRLVTFAVAIFFACGATAHAQMHPPTTDGAGAKPGPSGGKIDQDPGSNRPETKNGADSQQNRSYGGNTKPDGKSLNDGQPPRQ